MVSQNHLIKTAVIHLERDGTKWTISEMMQHDPKIGYKRILQLKSKDIGESEKDHGILLETEFYEGQKDVPALDLGQAKRMAMERWIR